MREGLHEIIPGRLYQRGNMLKWPAARKRQVLGERGISVVVNCWNKVDPDLSGMVDHYLDWPIATNELPPDADLVTEYVAGLVRAGHIALIHCEAGVNRSVWFALRVALELGVRVEPDFRVKLGAAYAADLIGRAFPGVVALEHNDSDLRLSSQNDAGHEVDVAVPADVLRSVGTSLESGRMMSE